MERLFNLFSTLMESTMRKLISLCIFAMLAVSPLTMAQAQDPVEAAIVAAVASEGSAEDAYATLTSAEDTTLTQAQKDALIALGAEAGAAYIAAVNSGASLAEAAVAASAFATDEAVNNLVAQLNTTGVQTETAAGAPAAGATGIGAPGAGAGGAGGGGTGGGVVSVN